MTPWKGGGGEVALGFQPLYLTVKRTHLLKQILLPPNSYLSLGNYPLVRTPDTLSLLAEGCLDLCYTLKNLPEDLN